MTRNSNRFGLSLELITRDKLAIPDRKEIGVLTFRALGLRIRSEEELTLETSALEPFYGGQFTFSYQLY